MVVVKSRAVMRGESSGREIAMTRLVEGAGGVRWVREWTSIGLVGRRQAWICWATFCVRERKHGGRESILEAGGRRRKRPKTAFGETPEEGISLKVKGCAFPVGVRPCFGEPGDVKTSVVRVGDSVKSVGLGKTDCGFCEGMGGNGELCASR
jgi:hypothetical protein